MKKKGMEGLLIIIREGVTVEVSIDTREESITD